VCGIAGIVHFDSSNPVSSRALQEMCDALTHRGPDDSGTYVNKGVGLGMRRLSIIDLSTGHQPITNEDGTIWIVFNGEIYNYQELRRQLETRGHQLKTTTDTEVIIHLYEDHGEECVHFLRGMFAFAIWDDRQQALLLARDRLGIKPLYYSQTPRRLMFASELKALLTHPETAREIDPLALNEYFTHLCVPGELSIFKAVKKLPPAHVLLYRNGQADLRQYWHAQPAPDEMRTEEEWIEQLQDHLRMAVGLHLVADVPLGAFLSGGLDSGAMIALMARESAEPIRTFTVGLSFPEGNFDEREPAKRVAERYGTQHTECLLASEISDIIPRVVGAFDEPFADSSAIPNWLICRETARHVKVALSGLGGDELFGGYERYVGFRLAETYRKLPRVIRSLARRLAFAAPAGNGSSYLLDRVKRFAAFADRPPADRYRGFFTAFDNPSDILHPDLHSSVRSQKTRYDEILRGLQVHDPLDLPLFADLRLYLPDDLLTLTDRVSMAHSLEVRVPFLDHELVEFVAQMPARLKVRGFRKKILFRRAISAWIPPENLNRRKQGFSVPLASWLTGSLQPLLIDLVHSRECRESAWLNHNAIHRLVDDHLTGRRNHEVRLWAIICFLEWQHQYLQAPIASGRL